MNRTKFAYQDYFGIQQYFAIQPNGDYMRVSLLCDPLKPTILTGTNYVDPEVWEPSSCEEFTAAYEKAQLAITESFLKACPQGKAPKVTVTFDAARALIGDGEE